MSKRHIFSQANYGRTASGVGPLRGRVQSAYNALMTVSRQRMGWYLLLPLHAADSHYLTSIRIPARDEQKEFDELVAGLTKVVVDSFNESELQALLPQAEQAANVKGISKLELMLKNCRGSNYDGQVKFLRNLQELRSSATAHRKGKNFFLPRILRGNRRGLARGAFRTSPS